MTLRGPRLCRNLLKTKKGRGKEHWHREQTLTFRVTLITTAGILTTGRVGSPVSSLCPAWVSGSPDGGCGMRAGQLKFCQLIHDALHWHNCRFVFAVATLRSGRGCLSPGTQLLLRKASGSAGGMSFSEIQSTALVHDDCLEFLQLRSHRFVGSFQAVNLLLKPFG